LCIRTSIQAHVWSIEVMVAFWQSLLFIALAEMGDKTQLVALAFATRFSARLVLGAIFVATLIVHLSVAIAFFLAELGDKTLLATVTLASQYREAMPVWLGSTLGMVVADGIAVIVGLVVGKRLPTRAIKYGSAAVFILSGLVTIGALMV
jgi:putative Ca2+/H+ antiporter (TMEM165/GDT1 family)